MSRRGRREGRAPRDLYSGSAGAIAEGGSGRTGRRTGTSAAKRAAEARERRNWRVAIASLLGLVAFLGMTLGVLFSDLFRVQEVQVVCADESLQAEAADRAKEIAFGTIWLPPTRAIEARIGGLARAQYARIDRHLPATLVIVVEPRQPVAFVVAEGRYMAVDPEGICLHWTGAPSGGMPTMHIENPSSLEVGHSLSDRDVALMTALMDGLDKTGLHSEASIDISHPIRITVFTGDGVLGKLGDEALLYEKTLLFGKLLHALRSDGETPLYIDLRVPSRPTYRQMN